MPSAAPCGSRDHKPLHDSLSTGKVERNPLRLTNRIGNLTAKAQQKRLAEDLRDVWLLIQKEFMRYGEYGRRWPN
jgi:hypothetical protein